MKRQQRATHPDDLDALRKRDPGAVERWFLEHADVVYTFAFYRVGKDEELATDVVQDVFVTALDKIGTYDPSRGAMLAWLTYTARNCIRTALRKRGQYGSYAAYWEQIDQRLVAACRKPATSPSTLPRRYRPARATRTLDP